MKLAALLRAHSATLLVVVVGVVAFSFLAVEDRTARHAAGIDDTCAWFQMVNRQFPMNRCFSLDEFFAMLNRHRGNPDEVAEPNGEPFVPAEENSDRDSNACEASGQAQPSETNRPRGPDYVYSLLYGSGCNEPQDRAR